jgi:hypothetical protein
MSPSRPLLLAILSATTTLGLLTLGAPSVASAAVAPNALPSTAHSAAYAPSTSSTSSTGGAATPATVSPSGCVQQADYPHKSTHVPGTMNGTVRTTCRVYVPRISENAQMWEKRWWGWDRIGIKGSAGDIDSRVLTVNASDKCRNNTVRVTGSGSVIDVDGRTYYATTESIHVNNPCQL